MKILRKKPSRASGYRAMTTAYRLPCEQGLLDAVLADMRRGEIDHVLVEEGSGVSVWRRGRNQAEPAPNGVSPRKPGRANGVKRNRQQARKGVRRS